MAFQFSGDNHWQTQDAKAHFSETAEAKIFNPMED